ncbi:MAG: polyprenyl synthetase family protein [Promethearchaeota archaeon]
MEKEFLEYLDSEKKIINSSIQNYFQQAIQDEEEPFLREFLSFGQYFIVQGGRRLLPISLKNTFMGLSSEKDILEYSSEALNNVSVSIEMLHVSNLMIDDLIDKEEYRRGYKTFHRFISEKMTHLNKLELEEYAISSTIYGANIISLMGSQIIKNSKFNTEKKEKALALYLNGMLGMTRAHLLEEYYKQVPLEKINLENYLILADKRAKQMETAVGLGAVFGNARKSQMEPLMQAMNKVGIIAQIVNDIDGSFGKTSDKKSYDSDIKSGQNTILTVVAYQSADKKQKKILNKVLGNRNATFGEIESVRDIFKNTEAVNFATIYSNNLKNDVYRNLQKVYPGLRKEIMDFYSQLLGYITDYKE